MSLLPVGGAKSTPGPLPWWALREEMYLVEGQGQDLAKTGGYSIARSGSRGVEIALLPMHGEVGGREWKCLAKAVCQRPGESGKALELA